MISLEGAVRALIVTKSERLVIVQQRCRRLRKTLDLLGLKPLDCLPCFEKFSQLSPRKNPLYNDVNVRDVLVSCPRAVSQMCGHDVAGARMCTWASVGARALSLVAARLASVSNARVDTFWGDPHGAGVAECRTCTSQAMAFP